MSFSRVIGILSFIATVITVAATALQVVKPEWAVYAIAISGAINAFVERVQGGVSVDKPKEDLL